MLMEQPLFYRLVQSILANQGHQTIKSFLTKHVTKKALKILDQGCGTGEYALLFGNKYYGIDNNPNDIKFAMRNYPGRFFVGSADKMPFRDNEFDLVFAVGLHHHLDGNQAKKAFLEALRVVKGNGKVVVIDAMLPKHKINFIGLLLRKLDRGKYVRKYQETLKLLPKKILCETEILSSWPFDYLALVIRKSSVTDNN